MPPVEEQAKIATAFSTPHDGVHRHTFVGANFFMQQMLNAHHDELGVDASTGALTEAAVRTTAYLQSQAARITVGAAQLKGSSLSFSVMVQNLSGHKFPTGFPSRRAWIHVVVTDSTGKVVFESGKLNPDGSIVGNANDTDPARYSPHFAQITEANQVEIFEPILGDTEDHVTTGLLAATHYLKDNRILPDGFDKESSPSDTAVRGNAATDPKFVGGSATTEYVIATHGAAGPLHVYVELAYQPVGYRWAHNLASYKADEPTRFVAYYDQVGSQSALVIARAETNVAAR